MVKIIRYGRFQAEVDTSDYDDVKIVVTMCEPLLTSDYTPQMEHINWENELLIDAKILRQIVEDYIMHSYEEVRLSDAV